MARWKNFALAAIAGGALIGCSGGDAEDDASAASKTCKGANCKPGDVAEAAPARPDDGIKNGAETDIDCGGGDAAAARCADGKACLAGTDCSSKVCGSGQCQAPSPSDGAMNGTETDVDCGGTDTSVPRCAAGRSCQGHGDCASDGCGYTGKCVAVRSCAGHFGGDTCGAGEVGAPDAQHESCCAAAPISEAPGAVMLDKYVVTAGRMRQFIERFDGNLKSFAEGLGSDNPDWSPAWTEMLPSSIAQANFQLGPTGHGSARAGCDLVASRGRTYWMSDAENDALGDGHHPFDKDTLDQKALNCVDFYMLQALCVWDGGHLATQDEIQTAWTAGEGRDYPWGSGELDTSRVVYNSNYQFPEVYDQGNFIYIAAPGRRPTGNGKFGHSDLAGLVIEITSSFNGANIAWGGNGSWEGHGINKGGVKFADTTPERGYWAAGGRCAHRVAQ